MTLELEIVKQKGPIGVGKATATVDGKGGRNGRDDLCSGIVYKKIVFFVFSSSVGCDILFCNR